MTWRAEDAAFLAAKIKENGFMSPIVRKLKLEIDKPHLEKLDASFEYDTVLAVTYKPSGIVFSEEKVDQQIKKSFSMTEALSEISEFDGSVVAEIEGVPRAFASISYEKWNRRAILRHLYVDKGFRGKGLATALITSMLKEALSLNARCLWIETQNTNFPAIQFYKANGFELCGLDRSLYDPAGPAMKECALFFFKGI